MPRTRITKAMYEEAQKTASFYAKLAGEIADSKQKVDDANVRLIERVKVLENTEIDLREKVAVFEHKITVAEGGRNAFRDLLHDLVVEERN